MQSSLKSKWQAWLYAFRLRTLPLAFSSIITGSSIAYGQHPDKFSYPVFGLCLLTTLLLQVLSNLANDYGDSEKGTDNENRIGPKRAVQAGLLSYSEIKTGIALTVILSLSSGIGLIYYAFGSSISFASVFFFLLGISAIAAAIKYTVGKSAYGYQGLGDVFVFIFFGLTGVCGSFYLQANTFHWTVLLPAASIGMLSAGVLNLNNMRDAASDAMAGKNTLVVKIGLERAKKYHLSLIVGAFISAIVFVILNFTSTMQLLFIVTAPLFRKHLVFVRNTTDAAEFDPMLKQLALGTFIFSLFFAAGMIVGVE